MKYKKGLSLALIAAVISGFSIFINKLAEGNWSNSSLYTTEKNIIAALLLTAVAFGAIKHQTLLKIKAHDWLKIILIGLIGGSIPFLLFFKGLSLTDASSAGFWNKTIFIWVAILAWPILKEKLSKIQMFAFGLIILGNLSLLWPFKLMLNEASILILLATVAWALEYILAKKFMSNIRVEILAWGRMFFGSIFLLLYLLVTNQASGLFKISAGQLPWLLIVGLILFIYVTFWYGALKRLPAALTAAVMTIASPITTLLNNIYYGKTLPNYFPLYAGLMLTGIILFLIYQNREKVISQRQI